MSSLMLCPSRARSGAARANRGHSLHLDRNGLKAFALLFGLVAWQSSAAAQSGAAVTDALPTIDVNAAPSQATSATTPAPQPALEQPAGETIYTQSRDSYDDKPALTIGDMLSQTPGVTFQTGNGPRDLSISIRGSNDHMAFGIRNIQILEDGFPLVQPDGRARADLIDPHAYGSIDTFQGPASTLYGNYATGGALFLHTRNPADVNGIEIGSDFGNFGTINNYVTIGETGKNYQLFMFGSDVRGETGIAHTQYDTPTENILLRVDASPTDRFIFKLINNNTITDQSVRLSLDQFEINPFQKDCAGLQSAACGSVTLLRNGAAGATVNVSPEQAGLRRDDWRMLEGVRWEHDLDANTLVRTQVTYDRLKIDQPNTAVSEAGNFDSVDLRSDITNNSAVFSRPLTSFAGIDFNYLDFGDHFHNLLPTGDAAVGPLSQTLFGHEWNASARFQEDLQFAKNWDFVTGLGGEFTHIDGTETNFNTSLPSDAASSIIAADRSFFNLAPEASLIYKPNQEWTLHSRVGTGYGTPQPNALFTTPQGTFGNNTQLKAQSNVGFDLGAQWTPLRSVSIQATGFYEFFRNEQITQSAGAGLQNFTFNAPGSQHRGVELAALWQPLPQQLPEAHLQLSYLYDNQVYTNFSDTLSNATTTASFNRDGNAIPGVVPHFLDARFLYDEDHGPLKGVGGFVELVYRSSFYLDNANLLQAPGYEIVNAGLHYNPPVEAGPLHKAHIYFEVENLLDKTYVGSASNITDTLGTNGQVGDAATLAAHTGSIFAGNPRGFYGGLKLSF